MDRFLQTYVALTSFFATPSFFVTRRDDEEGATAVEYGLMVALIAVVIITAVALIGTNLSTMFNAVAGKIKTTIP